MPSERESVTCEVVVMNQGGVALAADSALTWGENQKIYCGAEKLFQLTPSCPIGIMVYDQADIMGMPWEIVIKTYAEQRGNRKLGKVEHYANDFLNFVEEADALFPETVQRDYVKWLIYNYWSHAFAEPMAKAKNAKKLLGELLERDHERWAGGEVIDELSGSYGEKILQQYEDVISQIEAELFPGQNLSLPVRDGLRGTVKYMFTQVWTEPFESGIVFAGIGEGEPFPAVAAYNVGTIAAGKLRFSGQGVLKIDRENTAEVVPFAQTDMVDMFYRGIHPDMAESVLNVLLGAVDQAAGPKSKRSLEDTRRRLTEALEKESEKYREPLMSAVSALPREDLARMAEAFVSLTQFRAKMSADRLETVAGAIDVAVISKGEGFAWVKRKGRTISTE